MNIIINFFFAELSFVFLEEVFGTKTKYLHFIALAIYLAIS